MCLFVCVGRACLCLRGRTRDNQTFCTHAHRLLILWVDINKSCFREQLESFCTVFQSVNWFCEPHQAPVPGHRAISPVWVSLNEVQLLWMKRLHWTEWCALILPVHYGESRPTISAHTDWLSQLLDLNKMHKILACKDCALFKYVGVLHHCRYSMLNV